MFEITDLNFDKAYDILESSFIPAELKERSVLRAQWEDEEVRICGIEHNGTMAGVITVWEFENFVFIENFAINENVRGKGLGGKLLSDVINNYEKKQIILEVEPAKDEIQKRRIAFYERNGFALSPFGYIQPPLRSNCENVALQIMHTGKTLFKTDFECIKDNIFRTVYKCI